MSITFQYDPALHAVVTTVTEVINGNDAIANLEKVLCDDDLPDGFIEVKKGSKVSEDDHMPRGPRRDVPTHTDDAAVVDRHLHTDEGRRTF